jgi:hydroxymethylglutaryl-CoA lyase
VAAGLTRVEAASFVSPKAVPSMAGGAEVIDRLRQALEASGTLQGIKITALVPNLRGAEDALAAGVDEITVTVAASPAYNEKNVRRSIDDSVADIARITERAHQEGIPVDVVISCAFGSPYEDRIEPKQVADLAARVANDGNGNGAVAVTLADTTGVATPPVIETVLEALDQTVPHLDPGLHLHETRGTALANAYAALTLGISRFDSSIGGLGGSPFADGAGGNLATEDFVAFLEAAGVETGVDLGRLLEAARLTSQLVGRELPSKVRHR